MTKSRKRVFWEYFEAIVTALLLALVIRAYVVQAFKIPTGSMKVTLLEGDYLLVNKFLYGTKLPFSDHRVLPLRNPEKGDIIVFKYPKNPDRDFIKRIIAVGGDVIESVNKKIYVNKKPVEEPYKRHTDVTVKPAGLDARDNFGPFVVPDDSYFVMGDNRDQSYDSRFWGFVSRKAIKGKAMIIYWSWNGEKARSLTEKVRWGRITRLVR